MFECSNVREIELLRFLMCGALAAVRAELHLLQTLGRRLLVPSRRVVTVLALSASQYREITHFSFTFYRSSRFKVQGSMSDLFTLRFSLFILH